MLWLKQLFCKHNFIKVEADGIGYTLQCTKCFKTKDERNKI